MTPKSETPGTAVAAPPLTAEERAAKRQGNLPQPIKDALTLRAMTNTVAKELAAMSWGAALSNETRGALAEWGQQHGVDVAREIYILGNRIYLNSEFYQRKLGELVAADEVDYFYADHVNADDRLDAMAKAGNKGAKEEQERRATERVKYNIRPDDIAGACVFHIKPKALEREVTAAKWCGPNSGKKDPVGAEFPTLTAESRAIRRAMRLLVSVIPDVAASVGPAELAAKSLELSIHADHQQVKEWAKEAKVKPLLASGDAYAEPKEEEPKVEVVVEPAPTQPHTTTPEKPPEELWPPIAEDLDEEEE